MIQASYDSNRQLLKVEYSGQVTLEECRAAKEKIRSELAKTAPGFRLLTNLSHLTRMDVACAEPLGDAMDLIRQAGAQFVVRIIPSPGQDIGFNILSVFHYGHSIQTAECETEEEAAALLED